MEKEKSKQQIKMNIVGQHLGEKNSTSLHKNAMATKCKVWAYELSTDTVLRA